LNIQKSGGTVPGYDIPRNQGRLETPNIGLVLLKEHKYFSFISA
jgi:hypothetical protein